MKNAKIGKPGGFKPYSEAKFNEKISLFVATFFYSGFLPLAPGTWSSVLAAFFIYALIPTHGIFFLIFCFALFIVGIITADILKGYDGIDDNPKVTIDEVLGFAIAVAFIPKTTTAYLLAFIAFRVFDIWKPQPIKYLDKNLKGGLGVMVDDIVAGVFANILLRVILTVL